VLNADRCLLHWLDAKGLKLMLDQHYSVWRGTAVIDVISDFCVWALPSGVRKGSAFPARHHTT